MKKLNSFIIIGLFILSIAFSQDKPKEAEKPVITLESLQTRLESLNKGREQAIATVNAYDGAIQECNYWISVLTPKEEKKDEPKRVEKPDKK